ncbi:MAG: DUF1697 domain-containing protein [Rhizobiaceae bacterium]
MSGKGSVFVALYRGINVGGNNPVKMEALRAMHDALGHKDAKTYVQSGNVVFRAAGTDKALESAIAAAFEKEFGFPAKVMVRGARDWKKIVADNPYAKEAAADPKKVHVEICHGAPDKERIAALLEKTGGPEAFEIVGHTLYMHAPDGIGRSKFAAGLERACAVPATGRNWRTVEALQAIAEELKRD